MVTIEATSKRSENFPNIKFKMLDKTGLLASICRFGFYRINDTITGHHKAMELALANGINLIDTSANYTDGGSEKLIGNVLHNPFLKGELIPNDLIIFAKVVISKVKKLQILLMSIDILGSIKLKV